MQEFVAENARLATGLGNQPDTVIDLTGSEPVVSLLGSGSLIGERYEVDSHRIEFLDASHPAAAGLLDLEVAQLVDLGDREDEARAWLEDLSCAVWAVVLPVDAPLSADLVEGILRLTVGAQGDRALRDLAVLLDRPIDEVNREARTTMGLSLDDPIVDITTLDIPAPGGRTRTERFANVYRLIQAMMLAQVRLADDGYDCFTGMVHPQVFGFFNRAGMPSWDLGYGELRYKLTDENTNPMPTLARFTSTRALVTAIEEQPTEWSAQIPTLLEQRRAPSLVSTWS